MRVIEIDKSNFYYENKYECEAMELIKYFPTYKKNKICQDGVRNLNLKFMFLELFYPVSVCLGLALAIPCVLSRSIAPQFSK